MRQGTGTPYSRETEMRTSRHSSTAGKVVAAATWLLDSRTLQSILKAAQVTKHGKSTAQDGLFAMGS